MSEVRMESGTFPLMHEALRLPLLAPTFETHWIGDARSIATCAGSIFKDHDSVSGSLRRHRAETVEDQKQQATRTCMNEVPSIHKVLPKMTHLSREVMNSPFRSAPGLPEVS